MIIFFTGLAAALTSGTMKIALADYLTLDLRFFFFPFSYYPRLLVFSSI